VFGVKTTDDLADRFRRDVDDPLRGPTNAPDNDALWSIQDVCDYMQDASDKVARATLSRFSTFSLAVVGGTPTVALPTGQFVVLDIRRVFLASTQRELQPQTIDTLHTSRHDYAFIGTSKGWETLTGVPRDYIRDYIPGQLRLVPAPEANDTITITACVSPALIPGAPLPFNDPNDAYLMLLWMKKLAYQKHDADTFDPERSKGYEQEFETRAIDRAAEARRLRRAVQPVRFSW
jgi:hypothetical protein